MGTIRSFIALELPDSLRKALAKVQQNLLYQTNCVRWVKPENIHLTLKFIGYIDESQGATISLLLTKICTGVSPFAFSAIGIGAFPNKKNPKVIWVGIREDQQQILCFQKKLDEALGDIGLPKEKRPFTPHLTLGRMKVIKDKKAFEHLLEQFSEANLGSYQSSEVVFFRSDLLPTGPRYTAIKTVQL